MQLRNSLLPTQFCAGAEKVVGWAKNHYLSSCSFPSVKGQRLHLPRERYHFIFLKHVYCIIMLQYLKVIAVFSCQSLEIAILRLKEQETASRKPTQNLKACILMFCFLRMLFKWLTYWKLSFTSNICYPRQNLAKDEYESNFVSAVVPPGEIGVRFDDIGALEDVKKALNELVILPMRRPDLFSRGNLLRVYNRYLCRLFWWKLEWILCYAFTIV